MSRIINLTQIDASAEQKADGVFDLEGYERQRLVAMLTFDEVPSMDELTMRCNAIADLAAEHSQKAMLGGHPAMVAILDKILKFRDVEPLYSFEKRVKVDHILADGSVLQVAVVKHSGWWPTSRKNESTQKIDPAKLSKPVRIALFRMAEEGIPLSAALVPSRSTEFLRLGGVGRKCYQQLQLLAESQFE